MIKVNAPYITEDEIKAVVEVLRSGQLAHGPVVGEFERAFSEYLGVPYTVAVSNGTVALYLALKALGVGDGDEVIVPDFTFIATASMVVAAGAKPVFADIDLRTYTIDPEDVKKKISERTKAIIVVHLYGHPANMEELIDITREYNIYLIEDCAQSHGAEFKGAKTGTFGDVATFSFYATKNLTMGEGGAVVTKNKEIAEKVMLLRNHGQVSRYYHTIIGWNFRLTSIQAALGLQQLRKLDKMNSRRREIANTYLEKLQDIADIVLPAEMPWAKHVYHQFTIWVKKSGLRSKLIEYLKSKGIQTAVHYPRPLHLQPALSEFSHKSDLCPNSTEASKHVLSLPMHPGLTDEEIHYVAKTVREFFSLIR